ncbi:MAG: S1 family serine peptidase [Pseudomonadota bacterium]
MRYFLPALALGLAGPAFAQEAPPPAPQEQPEAAAAEAADEADDGGRIVGGEIAPAGSVPWQIEIITTNRVTPDEVARDREMGIKRQSWETQHHCGGALIADGWVLTAAHCFVSKDDSLRRLDERAVNLGAQDLRFVTPMRIERVAIFGSYSRKGDKKNDVALIRIEPIPGKTNAAIAARAKPIRMLGSRPGDRPLALQDKVIVTGWGITGAHEDGDTRDLSQQPLRASPELRQVGLQVKPQAECREKVRSAASRGGLGAGVICAGAGDLESKDSCSGDSGGPMTRAQGREQVLVGLVSWGSGCGMMGRPGIYANITEPAIQKWIERAKKSAPPGKVARVK